MLAVYFSDGPKEDSGRLSKWRYPGDKKVTFATKLPKLHPETLAEDWLPKEFQVSAVVGGYIR